MFGGLQKKWKVGGLQMTLIICTFAIGGSLTGYAGRKLLNLFSIESGWAWVVLYILTVCLLWPLAVLLISVPFGQFPFFMRYVRKIGARLGVGRKKPAPDIYRDGSRQKAPAKKTKQIAIFASGTGTNAQKIIDHFRYSSSVKIVLIVSNNPEAGVLKIAEKENIPALVLEKEKFFKSNIYRDNIKSLQVDFIVLAGFLWKVPLSIIQAFPGKILNIHPALLPKYGGKGMYGIRVHQAVLDQKEKESGISIHIVDEIYDHGKIIFQAPCPVLENDTAASLAARIHQLEYTYYPRVIESLVCK